MLLLHCLNTLQDSYLEIVTNFGYQDSIPPPTVKIETLIENMKYIEGQAFTSDLDLQKELLSSPGFDDHPLGMVLTVCVYFVGGKCSLELTDQAFLTSTVTSQELLHAPIFANTARILHNTMVSTHVAMTPLFTMMLTVCNCRTSCLLTSKCLTLTYSIALLQKSSLVIFLIVSGVICRISFMDMNLQLKEMPHLQPQMLASTICTTSAGLENQLVCKVGDFLHHPGTKEHLAGTHD